MPINVIPQLESPGTGILQGAKVGQNILASILAGKQREQQLAQQALADKLQNQYQMGELGLSREKFNEEKKLTPLKMDLLKAKIEQALREKYNRPNATQLKSKEGLQTQADSLFEALNKYKNLHNMLVKNPNLTGFKEGLASKIGFEISPGAAEFKNTSGELQAALARGLSARGGIQAFKAASTMKPDVGSQGNYNMSMIKAGIRNSLDHLDVINSHHRELTGQDLPNYYDKRKEFLDLISDKQVNKPEKKSNNKEEPSVVLYKNGKQYRIPPKLMQKALSEGFTLGD